MLRALSGVLLAVLLFVVGCSSGGEKTASPTDPTPTVQVNCKSPVTHLPVPKALAVKQAKELANTTNTTVNVDCGDDVVVVPPVVTGG